MFLPTILYLLDNIIQYHHWLRKDLLLATHLVVILNKVLNQSKTDRQTKSIAHCVAHHNLSIPKSPPMQLDLTALLTSALSLTVVEDKT